jgi:hypothetical protein
MVVSRFRAPTLPPVPPVQAMSVAASIAPPAEEFEVSPLSDENRRELSLARERSGRIRRAARVAGFNGWATALVALLSAPFALFSATSLVTTVALAVVACIEFRGRKRLLEFDPSAAMLLGLNQLGLLAMIIAYCLWTIHSSLYGANSVTVQLRAFAELEATLGSLEDIDALCRQLVVALYGSIIAISVVFQGFNSLYYFSRRKHVEAFLAETPAWIRDFQRG